MDHAYCPECGKRNEPHFARCDRCHAALHDVTPWRHDHNSVTIPLAILVWGLLMVGTSAAGVDYALADWQGRGIALGVLFVAMLIGGSLLRTGSRAAWQPAIGVAGFTTAAVALVMQLSEMSPISRYISDSISQAILLFGIYGVLVLWTKLQVTASQERAARVVRRMCAEFHQQSPDFLAQVKQELTVRRLSPHNHLIAYNRIHWIDELRAAGRTDREIADALSNAGDNDWEAISSSFMSSQFLVWLLPTSGFVGTVWGMTRALSSFSSLGGSDLAFRASLMATTEALGDAFHTTLVGLVAVIPVLALATIAQRRARNLLHQLDSLCLRLVMSAKESHFAEPGSPASPEPAAQPELPLPIVDEPDYSEIKLDPLLEDVLEDPAAPPLPSAGEAPEEAQSVLNNDQPGSQQSDLDEPMIELASQPSPQSEAEDVAACPADEEER